MKSGIKKDVCRQVFIFVVFMGLILTAQPDLSFGAACNISINPSLPVSVIVGNSFSLRLTASGGTSGSTYTWSFSGVPAWMSGPTYSSRNVTADFSGTPPGTGTWTITAQITGTSNNKCTARTLACTPSCTITAVAPTITISGEAAKVVTEGVSYSPLLTLSASPGTAPYAWSATGLPSGITINTLAGTVSGTPAAGSGGAAGTNYNVQITVADTSGFTSLPPDGQFVITVNPPSPPLAMTTVGLMDGTVAIPYSYTLGGSGGTTPYTWSATGLPSGLSINSSTGVISGTPASGTAGDSTVTVILTDGMGATVSRAFTLHINAAAVVALSNMANYCNTPPFIAQELPPNLLLMVDNSASMFDLNYIDKGVAGTRDPYYCYDQTYKSTTPYAGYFDKSAYYEYDSTTSHFETLSGSFPGSAATCSSGIAKYIANTLCIDITNTIPMVVSRFIAKGNYLNWLTASKFDVQKHILTGGKYDGGAGELVSESRGCVGRRFIKEALTADYVEGGTNTSLGITFTVRGPLDPNNPTQPSPGGQTYVDIFYGDYDQGTCQTAVDIYADTDNYNHQDRRDATSTCLEYDSHDSSLPGKTQNVFIQSVQECYQYDTSSPHTVGGDAANTVKNQCPDILNGFSPGYCSVTTTTSCTTDAGCPGGEICIVGPLRILPGNAGLLCSTAYTGACYVGAPPYNKSNYSGCIGTDCGDACILAQHNKYCGDFGVPPVIDPTDDPSATETYYNVPAILGDFGVEGQLSSPIKQMRVRLQTAERTGKIQKFKDIVRFGLLTFNFNGSAAECSDTSVVKCPRVCSNDPLKTCATYLDCPHATPSPTCDLATTNKDGARIKHHIGDPAFAANPVGDHNAGLIRDLDEVRADSWTPFSEGLYSSVAYFTQNTSDSSRPRRLNTDDFNTTTNPIQSSCQANNVLLITDGMSTTDQNSSVLSIVSSFNDGDGQTTTAPAANGLVAPKYFGSKNLDDLAWYANHKNIFSPADPVKKPREKISSHILYTGNPCGSKGADLITCTETDETIPEVLMQHTVTNGGGLYAWAGDADTFSTRLEDMLTEIARRTASGTAASVLASGEGSGANLIQAVFYPAKKFDDTTIRWIGRLTNLWYYIDPFFGASSIYEDNASSKILDLRDDNRVTLNYDPAQKKTMASRSYDASDDGVPDTIITPDIDFEKLKSIWDAGLELWKRDLSSSPRRIKTSTGSSLVNFSTANAATLRPYLQAANNTEATNIINYTHGYDFAGYRPRTVKVDLNGDGDVADTDVGGYNETVARVWKLGDVIQSTPRIATRFPLNTFNDTYNDSSYGEYITSTDYGNRGIVFGGANDGMLHAFKLGKLDLNWSGRNTFEKARITNLDTSKPLGSEIWAFIPKNVLPYLKYLAEPGYCHIYSVDLSPYIFDASIGAPADGDVSDQTRDNSSWRTILIGGMRLGGACRKSNSSCTDCVKTPGVDLNGSGTVSGDDEISLGMSSYFALDITATLNDPSADPTLLWEFTPSNEDLGFTTPGPSVVRISSRVDPGDPTSGPDRTKNGKWYVVIGSGPTGRISTSDHQFMGSSDQNLKIHIIDLKNGPVSGSYWALDTSIQNAFAGSMVNSTIDADLDYQDDVVHVPYVRKCDASMDILDPCTSGTWTNGGVGRLLTKEDPDPSNWRWSEVMDGIGPVTSAVAHLETVDKSTIWLYFGTGRYSFEQDTPDDKSGQRILFGIKEPCYSSAFESDCSDESNDHVSVGDLTNVTDIDDVPADPSATGFKGWYINLDLCTNSAGTVVACSDSSVAYRAERVITDPLAVTSGVVFFTTVEPKDDSCEPSGKSAIWAVKFNSGGSPGAALKGKVLLQVSTGQIAQIDMASAFSEKDGRKAEVGVGDPPIAQGLSIISSPPPVKRVIHKRER